MKICTSVCRFHDMLSKVFDLSMLECILANYCLRSSGLDYEAPTDSGYRFSSTLLAAAQVISNFK